uniref:Fucosyltransferase C-terminal domain-containing protein n=1 Tax=viral metagenome TaxID=1070528 RepID=A0A6C0EN07_9ZZZZ
MTTEKKQWTVYCNAFWPGFLEGTDPVTVGFFLKLLSTALGPEASVSVTRDPAAADILLESLFGTSILTTRTWTYTVFFSGECRICPQYRDYDCVLWGEMPADSHDNVVCCPEFVPYLYSTGLLAPLEERSQQFREMPPRLPPGLARVCTVISNPRGPDRNRFLDILERYVPVDYGGQFRTNIPRIQAPYTCAEFRNIIGQYRFTLAMENSRGGHYVTEKITHALLTGTVPIYWGAPHVTTYFNPDRFIHIHELDEEGIGSAINDVLTLATDDEAYQERIAQPVFMDASGNPSHRLSRTLDAIAADMGAVLRRRK